jgi:hypothetical protein
MSELVRRMILASDALRERLEERAAIMEYDGHMTRKDADRRAMADLVAELSRVNRVV